MVKYIGIPCAAMGRGNGGRSTGIRVIVSRCTAWPDQSVTTIPAGIRTSRPGAKGLLTIVSFLVGEGMLIAWAVSNTGIQILYGSTVVCPAARLTLASKSPYVLPRRSALD